MSMLCTHCGYEGERVPAEVTWRGETLCLEHYVQVFDHEVGQQEGRLQCFDCLALGDKTISSVMWRGDSLCREHYILRRKFEELDK